MSPLPAFLLLLLLLPLMMLFLLACMQARVCQVCQAADTASSVQPAQSWLAGEPESSIQPRELVGEKRQKCLQRAGLVGGVLDVARS
jgi:hypothetical protein